MEKPDTIEDWILRSFRLEDLIRRLTFTRGYDVMRLSSEQEDLLNEVLGEG